MRRPKPAAALPPPTHTVYEDDELLDEHDDLQPATTSVQLATAMRASIASKPRLQPAQQNKQRRQPAAARQPTQQLDEYDVYDSYVHEEEQQQHTEEQAYDGREAMDSRDRQSAFTFTTASRPARRTSHSSSSSSSRPALTPTSMAAFDPLTTPATRTAASRAIKKRSSLSLPSSRPEQPQPLALAAPSHDPFDAIDPSPPSYEQVLASDDVIAAQFSGMLAIEPPAVDALHIRRAAQQEQRDQQHKQEQREQREQQAQQERQDVEDEVNAIMGQMKLKRPARPAKQRQRLPVRHKTEEREEEEDVYAEEVKRFAPARRQHPRYAMSAEEEEAQQDDVQQVRQPVPKTVQRVSRRPRAHEEEDAEQDQQQQVEDARLQQPREPRKRQPVVQRQQQLDDVEQYNEQPPVKTQVRAPMKKTVVAMAEEKTAGRRRSKLEEYEEYEEHEERKEVRDRQRRLSADTTMATVPARNARPARRSISSTAGDADWPDRGDRQSVNVKSDKLSRQANKSAAPRPLSASPHIRPTASSSASSTKPYRPSRIKVDALAFMQAGTPFLKYSSSYFSSPPHFRQFLLIATTPAYIQWFSQNKPLSASRVYLETITAITTGQATATFAKHKAVELESMSFSVLYCSTEGGKERSLDLTAKDKNELNVWVKGLERMVKLAKRGEELDDSKNWKRLLIELALVYGGNGSASQPLIDVETGRAVDVRGRSALKGASSGDVEASLYRDLQPRLQRLEAALLKRKEEVKSAKGSSVYTVVREKVKRVEDICRVVGDALMDGNLELADQQLWLGSLELDTVNDMIASSMKT